MSRDSKLGAAVYASGQFLRDKWSVDGGMAVESPRPAKTALLPSLQSGQVRTRRFDVEFSVSSQSNGAELATCLNIASRLRLQQVLEKIDVHSAAIGIPWARPPGF